MKNLNKILLCLCLLASSWTVGQNISINADGSAPDNSAMLDVSSTNRGILVPRLTITERNAITNPATGLLIYQTNSDSGFYYNSGTAAVPNWSRILSNSKSITSVSDSDGDTKIEVEQSADEDLIHFGTNGTEFFRIDSARIEILNTLNNIFIGQNSGRVYSFSNGATEPNLAIGTSTLEFLTIGRKNVAIGHEALQNTTLGTDNTAVGMSAGRSNTDGVSNTAIGAYALTQNTTGTQNTSLGRYSLFRLDGGSGNTVIGEFAAPLLTSGDANTIIGQDALENNTGSSNNTIIGVQAGRNNLTGGSNVFLGFRAGFNETGSNKLYIENTNTSIPLIYGDFANDSVIVNGSFSVNRNYTFPNTAPAANGDVLQYNGTNLIWGSSIAPVLSSVLTAGKDAGADSIFNLNAMTIGSLRAPKTSLEIDSFFVVQGKPYNGFRWTGFNAYYDGLSANPQYLNDGQADMIASGGNKLILGHWGVNTAGAILPSNALTSIELEDSSFSIQGEATNFTVYMEGKVGIGLTDPSAPLNIKSTVIADASDGAFIDIQNGSGVVSTLSGVRFKNNTIDGNSRYNAAIFHRVNSTTDYQLNFGVRLNAVGNLDTSDIKMTINDNGDVGIGTTTPSTRLSVSESSATSIMNLESSGSNTLMEIDNSGTNPATWTFGYLGNTGVNPGFMTFLRGGIHRMAITNNGDVGIGTTTPAYRLDVNGSARISNLRVNTANLQFGASMEVANRMNIIGTGSPNIFIGNTSSNYIQLLYNSSGYGQLFTAGANHIVLSAGGNVGIGVTNPSSELEVAGDIEIPATNDYTYSSAKTHYQSFAPTTFNALLPDLYGFGTNSAADFYAYFRSGTTAFGYSTVEVNLPDGATVTELEAWVYDNLTTNPVRVSLYRQALGSSVITTMAEIESTTATATTVVQNLTDNTIAFGTQVIDNENYAYFLMFTGRQNSTESRLYGTKITYTVTETD